MFGDLGKKFAVVKSIRFDAEKAKRSFVKSKKNIYIQHIWTRGEIQKPGDLERLSEAFRRQRLRPGWVYIYIYGYVE